jgi:uncharacterized cupredoxin-like copper-binding protein
MGTGLNVLLRTVGRLRVLAVWNLRDRTGKELMADKPSVTMPGTVEKIIKSPHRDIPEKAEIGVEGADHLYREIRIENKLKDENGNEVKLKEGASVEITVEAEAAGTTSKSDRKS